MNEYKGENPPLQKKALFNIAFIHLQTCIESFPCSKHRPILSSLSAYHLTRNSSADRWLDCFLCGAVVSSCLQHMKPCFSESLVHSLTSFFSLMVSWGNWSFNFLGFLGNGLIMVRRRHRRTFIQLASAHQPHITRANEERLLQLRLRVCGDYTWVLFARPRRQRSPSTNTISGRQNKEGVDRRHYTKVKNKERDDDIVSYLRTQKDEGQ